MQSSKSATTYVECLADLSEAVRGDPGNIAACIDLAWLLATCPDARIRNGPRAASLARHVLELDPHHPYLPETLAAAYAEAGNSELAVYWRIQSLDSLLLHKGLLKIKGGR